MAAYVIRCAMINIASSTAIIRNFENTRKITWRDVYHCTPDNTCSHTTRLTTMAYFNQLFNTVTLASSNSTLHDDGDHTETCWSYFNFNVNCNTPLVHHLVIKIFDKTDVVSKWQLCSLSRLHHPQPGRTVL